MKTLKRVKFKPKNERGNTRTVSRPSSLQFSQIRSKGAVIRPPPRTMNVDIDDEEENEEENEDDIKPIEFHTMDKLQASIHWSKKPLKDMNDRDWRIAMEDYDIKTNKPLELKPLRRWDESNLNGGLLERVKSWGFTPTGIQRGVIPLATNPNGGDILGLAPTGSGKTLGFCLPLLNNVLNNDKGGDAIVSVLVVTPTRELAIQIETQLRNLSDKVKTACVIGGRSYEDLDEVEVIVGTPGRLKDVIEMGGLKLNHVDVLVVDEADQMVNMGFQPQLQYIIQKLPEHKRTWMFSATMSSKVKELTNLYLNGDPLVVEVGVINKVVNTVEESVIKIHNDNDTEKMKILIGELKKLDREIGGKCIVFVNYQQSCDYLQRELDKVGIDSVTLHGGKPQRAREDALNTFKERCNVLIATDVAGRGVDLDVQLVVNYHDAKSEEDYTHRVGRTGRAGRRGRAIKFVTNSS